METADFIAPFPGQLLPIEGTFTTPEQLVLFEDESADAPQEATQEATREVQYYMAALDWALGEIAALPVSSRLIRRIHGRWLRGVRGEQQQPGEFRSLQDSIGRSPNPKDARFVPPPPDLVPDLIADLERFVHLPREERAQLRLVRITLVHYQLETIHPFRDGNGRVGRILIPLLLRTDDSADPPLYLSAFFEHRRREYYDLMLAVSQRGAYADWIEFFLEAVVESVQASLKLAHQLLALRTGYHELAAQRKWPTALRPLIDGLFEHPVLTIKKVEQQARVSTPTASGYLKKLESAGIVAERTGPASQPRVPGRAAASHSPRALG